MPVKVSFIMMYNKRMLEMLGGVYKNKFKVGEYVEYRRISRNENYEASFVTYQGIITDIKCIDRESRPVWYAKILQNGGQTDLVLLSKIRKLETN